MEVMFVSHIVNTNSACQVEFAKHRGISSTGRPSKPPLSAKQITKHKLLAAKPLLLHILHNE